MFFYQLLRKRAGFLYRGHAWKVSVQGLITDVGACESPGVTLCAISQLSSECCLFRTGWQNSGINNKPTQVKQPPNAAAMEKPHFQDKPITEATEWMFEHAGTTQISVSFTHFCAEGTTNTCPFPTLSHSASLKQLWRVAITGRDLSG